MTRKQPNPCPPGEKPPPPPIRPGTYSKGGLNPSEMTPRPNPPAPQRPAAAIPILWQHDPARAIGTAVVNDAGKWIVSMPDGVRKEDMPCAAWRTIRSERRTVDGEEVELIFEAELLYLNTGRTS